MLSRKRLEQNSGKKNEFRFFSGEIFTCEDTNFQHFFTLQIPRADTTTTTTTYYLLLTTYYLLLTTYYLLLLPEKQGTESALR